MKKLLGSIAVIGLVFTAQAQETNGNVIWDSLKEFISNNPSNKWDVTAYGAYNISKVDDDVSHGIGVGARVSYWITPAVGAAVDASYMDSNWTLANVSMIGRGTIKVGNFADITLHAIAGPAWNIRGQEDSIIAVMGTGGTLTFNKFPKWGLLGEYSHFTTNPVAQDRVMLGITYRF